MENTKLLLSPSALDILRLKKNFEDITNVPTFVFEHKKQVKRRDVLCEGHSAPALWLE